MLFAANVYGIIAATVIFGMLFLIIIAGMFFNYLTSKNKAREMLAEAALLEAQVKWEREQGVLLTSDKIES